MENKKILFEISDADKMIDELVNNHFKNQSDETKINIKGSMYTKEEYKVKIFTELSGDMSEKMIDDTLGILKESSDYFDSLQNERKTKMTKSLNKTILFLKTILDQSVELGKEVSKSNVLEFDGEVTKMAHDELTKFIMLRIHERSIEIMGEIILLIENGYSLGSLARWRTLNEYSVLMTVLEKNDDPELTHKYVSHEIVSYKKIAEDLYNINGHKVPDYNEIIKEYDELISKYGEEYKSPYGWYTPNPKINFNDLSTKYKVNVLNGYFRKSSMTNHGSSFDIIGKNRKPFKDLINEFETIVQNVVISISLINSMMLLYFMKKENKMTIALATYVSYFSKISETIAEIYFTERKVIDNTKPSYDELTPR